MSKNEDASRHMMPLKSQLHDDAVILKALHDDTSCCNKDQGHISRGLQKHMKGTNNNPAVIDCCINTHGRCYAILVLLLRHQVNESSGESRLVDMNREVPEKARAKNRSLLHPSQNLCKRF